MRVALVHDWLTGMRGGERCLEAFVDIFPQADIYTLIHVEGSTSEAIDSRVKQTSFLQRLPGIERYYRALLPLYPLAIRGFDFSKYDLVISLSHAAAKNINIPDGVPHICYCFTPMRYIWDQAANYFGFVTPLLQPILAALRAWDRKGSKRVTQFVAISRFIAARIRCFYGRRAEVIFPPVKTEWITPRTKEEEGEAFLYAGALVPYKRPDLVVEAFNKSGLPLWIVGSGPLEEKLKKIAKPNIQFFGRVADRELAWFYRSCRALLFPGKEDFGIIPVECMAAGRPVIGLGAGGISETVAGVWPETGVPPYQGASGVFLDPKAIDQIDELIRAVNYFVQYEQQFTAESCQEQAAKFCSSRFQLAINKLLLELELLAPRDLEGEVVNA